MPKRQYFSLRTGRSPAQIDLAMAKQLFGAVFERLRNEGYLQEWFGYFCVDNNEVPGRAGRDVASFTFLATLRPSLWPVHEHRENWTEDEFFDFVEFLFDHVSKGLDGWEHTYADCGWHYSTFDIAAGQQHYRTRVNEIMVLLAPGWELSPEGEIVLHLDEPVADLLDRPLPASVSASAQERVESAVRKYRSRSSSRDDRRDAVRDLADVLENIRPRLKVVLMKKDDTLIFEMANKFGIRHFDDVQRTDYDPVWLSWMFHFYLATIHAGTRLIERAGPGGSISAP